MAQTKAQLLGPVVGDVTIDTNTLALDSEDNRVGIGTASATTKLHVKETINTAYSVTNVTDEPKNLLKLENASTTANAFSGLHFRVGGGADMFFGAIQQTTNAGDFYFANQNSPNVELMRIKSDGKVGIGTDGPGAALHVLSSLYPTATIQRNHAVNYPRLRLINTSNHGGDVDGIGDGTPAGGIRFSTITGGSSTERFRITGIGNAVFQSNDRTVIIRNNGTSGYPSIDFRNTADSGDAFGHINGATLDLQTGGSTRLHIAANGRVNIGQASNVDHTLCVAGTDNTTGLTGSHNHGIQLQNKSTTDGSYSQIEWRTAGGGRYARIAGIQDDADGDGGQLVFLTEESGGTTAERIRISSAGKIGLSDSNPTRRLSVNGSINIASGERIESYSSGGNLIIQGGSTYPGGHIQMWGGTSSDMIAFCTSGQSVSSIERVRIDSSGRTLINLTASLLSYAGLQIKGDADSGAHICLAHKTATPVSGNNIGSVRFTNNAGGIGAIIGVEGDGTWSGSSQPSRIILATTASGATSPTERIKITNNGLVDVSGGIHVTENVTPTSGRGVEIFEASAGVGQISSFNRDANSWDELRLKGSEISMYAGGVQKIYVQSASTSISGTTDGVLNIDTTDSRGSFVRFKENGTTKAWIGCAEGIGTLGDQDDLGLRSVDKIILKPGGQSVYLGVYDAPGSYTNSNNNIPYSIKVAPYGWQHHSEIAEISMGSHYGTGQDDGQIIFKTAQNVHSDATGLVDRLRITENGILYVNGSNSSGGTSGAYTPVRIQGNSAATLGADVRVRGGSTGYTHSSLSLQSTSSGNSGGSRGLGVFMYDEVTDIEWYAGRPYSGNDFYMITRDSSVAYGSSSGQTAQHGKKVMALDNARRMSTSGREYHFSDRTYNGTHKTSRIITSRGKQGTLTSCTVVINCHSYGTLAYDISVGGYSNAGYARKGTLYMNGAIYSHFNSLNTSMGGVSHTFQYQATQKIELVFSKNSGFIHPVCSVDVSFGGDGYFDPGDVSITWS